MKYRKFGYKFKAIFCPLTSGKDYATISPTKRKNFVIIYLYEMIYSVTIYLL